MEGNSKLKWLLKESLINALRFMFNLLFISVFQILFGTVNIMAGIAIGVGWTMFPKGFTGVRPWSMAAIIVILYAGGSIVAQLALCSPWLALPFNLMFTAVLLLLSAEPVKQKPSISFLLCFIFCQSTPVSAADFPLRLTGVVLAGIFVAATALIYWKKDGHWNEGRTLKQQIAMCRINKGYILRMSLGLALAMFAGTIFDLKKPLWISIVVMSLTQIEFRDTIERIKHRSLATIAGVTMFLILFNVVIPEQYAFIVILALGYLSFFTPEYKYKQVVNAISAINASLILLDTMSAIQNRFFCLAGGVLIVVFMWFIQHPVKKLHQTISEHLTNLRNNKSEPACDISK